jgi:signal peptidase II
LSEQPRTMPWRWIVLATVIVIADQITKALVLEHIKPGQTISILPFLTLVLAFNTGAAFSFLANAGGWQTIFFSVIALGASAMIIYLLKHHQEERLFSFGLGLILGGAIGNLIDRVRLGKVVDFVLVHDYLPFSHPWLAWLDPFPAFNVADSAITCGAIAVILSSLRTPQPVASATKESA